MPYAAEIFIRFQAYTSWCAERTANAKLMHALGHRKGHYGVQTDHGDHQRERGKGSEQRRAEPRLGDRLKQSLFHATRRPAAGC
jgi:hypothetical protein